MRTLHARFLLLLLLLLLACAESKPQPMRDASATRKLDATSVLGLRSDYGNHAWLGLRYAEAPLGGLRFRAPKPYVEHASSVQAYKHGSPCPQLGHPFGVSDAPPGELIGSEDCLFLDVYAPRMSAEEAATAKLPVMLWIHGGGNVVGHAGGYDGGHLAQKHRVIVVAANYRLGPLGFMHHAALRDGTSAEDGSGNYGVLDLIEALRWVRARVAAFGGNPDNVTIFGESAGARDTMALLIAPAARGLFHRAIAQSGMARTQDADHAERFAAEGGHENSSNEVLARLVVRADKAKDTAGARAALAKMTPAAVAAFLREQTPGALIDAYARDEDESLPQVPNVFAEGAVVPREPLLELYARADGHAGVPVVLGTNRDENKTFMMNNPLHTRRIPPLYIRMRDAPRYDALADALSRAWKLGGADAPARALAASGSEVYVYRFDWDEEPSLLGADLSVILGAGHGLEIPFVFGHWDLGRQASVLFTERNQPGREALAATMMSYWAEIAWRGRPGQGRDGEQPAWTPYSAAKPSFMVLDTKEGGGVRAAVGSLEKKHILAAVQSDQRLRDARERCAVYRELARFNDLLTRAEYEALDGGACKSYGFDTNPFE
jgi:para-nitrobenzyl esterase